MRIYNGNLLDVSDYASDSFLAINSCGYQKHERDCTVIRPIGRRDTHILLVREGTLEVLHGGTLHTLEAGGVVIYAPHEEQRYRAVSEAASLWCHVSGTALPSLLDEASLTSGVYPLSPSRTLTETFFRMVRRHHQSGRALYARASLLELIYEIAASKNAVEPHLPAPIADALSYINEHYKEHPSTEALAARAGYSQSRFSHLFAAATGTTPLSYRNAICMELACEMLLSTSLSVRAIASACGFEDALYFSRLFKKHHGRTPSEYRLDSPMTQDGDLRSAKEKTFPPSPDKIKDKGVSI